MRRVPFVPPDFKVPSGLETDRLRLRMLSVNDVVKDYDAVVTSKERLLRDFNPGGVWPEGLTLEQNLIDLGWHQKEFQIRRSFAYTVVNRDETSVLGCLYIEPTDHPAHDARVEMWVRESEADTGLDLHLYEAVKAWIRSDWPFISPGYPIRETPMEEWK